MALAGISPDFGLPTSSQSSAQMTPVTQPAPYNWNVPGPNSNMGNIGVNQQVLGANTQAPAPTNNNTSNNNAPDYQQQWSALGRSGTAPVGWHGESAPSPDQAAIDKQITDTYNSSNDYLNQAESQVRSDFPTVQQDISGQYDTSKGSLDTTHNTSVNQLNQNTDQSNYAHESALAAARRLYSELRQGYQQRFGGSSSAADAANQIASVEQQRQEGQQNHGYQDTLTTINNHRQDVESQYQTGLQSLLTQKNTAMNQANRDFQNKLLTISQSRAANEQAKGQARLQALQDLRNQVFQINQQNTQFQQTLEAQRQQSQLQLQNYQALAGQGVSGAAQSAAGYNLMASARPVSTLQPGGQGQQQQSNYTGAINTNGKTFDPSTGQWY